MKILVINGSPKGKNSITFQTALFLKQKYTEHQYSVLHVGARYRSYENDFEAARKRLSQADLIIFAYPVYTFLVPAQLHRFVELMKADIAKGNLDLSGKFCTQISTSKHFYDVTAHRFIEDNCLDMGMRVLRGLSADMDDLTTKKGRGEASQFFEHILWQAQEKSNLSIHEASVQKALEKVVVVADIAENDYKLRAMVDKFVAITGNKAKVVDIHEFPFRGGCISCFNCSTSGECIYTDGFQELLRNEIQGGTAIVLAFTVKDHSMGSVFKTYDDRQFCNGHRTVTMGMPFGYIISGDLAGEENLRTVIEARAQVGGNYLAGIATDERNTAESIADMAKELAWCIEHKYTQPANFYGVGGMKIFRDLIWQMQGMMKADYKFYKENGQLDFPQKKPGRVIAMYAVGAMMGNPKLKKKMGNKMSDGMLMPYRKAVQEGLKE